MKVIFQKKEVFILPKNSQSEKTSALSSNLKDLKSGGTLQIIKNKDGHFVRFISYYDAVNEEDWTYIGNHSREGQVEVVALESKAGSTPSRLQFNINSLCGLRRDYSGLGPAVISFQFTDDTEWPVLQFQKGGSKEFLNELRAFFIFSKDARDSHLLNLQRQTEDQYSKQSAYEMSLFGVQQADPLHKFTKAPVSTTLLNFSKMTSKVRDLFLQGNAAGDSQKVEHDAELCNALIKSIETQNIHTKTNDGFEMVIQSAQLGPKPVVLRCAPINRDAIHYDREGRVVNEKELKKMVFKGGIHPSLRSELWKFLLGVYQWDSTLKIRIEEKQAKENEYYRMKLQWKSFSEDQKSRCSIIRDRESLIWKDVWRTDRTYPFFAGDTSPNLEVMKDILMTYNMYNFDLGYVQGMSDLVAPLMTVFDNEVDSFWGFVGFMNKMEPNFVMDQQPIKIQLAQLQTLLEFIDAAFAEYLEQNGSLNMYFCFRWILIWYKREFEFDDILKLWETLWTEYPCKNFHLLIGIAVLLMKKRRNNGVKRRI